MNMTTGAQHNNYAATPSITGSRRGKFSKRTEQPLRLTGQRLTLERRRKQQAEAIRALEAVDPPGPVTPEGRIGFPQRMEGG
jgi:hypothetical protein